MPGVGCADIRGEMMTTLYERLVECEVADVYDDTWDTPTASAWVLPADSEGGDAFDRVSMWMVKNIEEVSYDANAGNYKITAFVNKYRELFTEFMREFNYEEYQFEGEDGEYNAVMTAENLNIGNYGEDAYEWLDMRLWNL